ncbi:hypothetical protein [Profundibacter sp.]
MDDMIRTGCPAVDARRDNKNLHRLPRPFFHPAACPFEASFFCVCDALHAELYQLWTGSWEVALREDGLILAHRNL